jgi:hypothetical protein
MCAEHKGEEGRIKTFDVSFNIQKVLDVDMDIDNHNRGMNKAKAI